MNRQNIVASVVALVGLGILACDEEEAPTAPAEEPALSVAAVPDASANAALAPITLPVNGTFNGSAPAFRITQTGTGPNGIFQISNATNTAVALLGQTSGRGIAVRGLATSATGRAGVFESTSGTGSQDVLFAKANNNGTAIHAVANGFGLAGKFEGVRNSGSGTLYVSALGAGNAISAVNTGTGPAGSFVVSNPQSRANALYAETNGSPGGLIATAIRAINRGMGHAGSFTNNNPDNPHPVLHAHAVGLGATAGSFTHQNREEGRALFVDGTSYFSGTVRIAGTIIKPAGSFQIDHPLDPERKYLSHSFVESPDMLNVYDGTATVDGRGEAVVMLPNYFEALNRDFRYQLTAIGAPGPNLHISQEIRHNRFVIAGGVPGTRVSWQVTGVRQDAYAEAHRIQVETDKPEAERGVALAH